MEGYGYGYCDPVMNILELFRRVPQEEIYEFVVGYRPIPHKYVFSPLRQDSKPGAWYEWYNGILYFVDFREYALGSSPNKDCIQVLQEMKNISRYEATRMICSHFNASDRPRILPAIVASKRRGSRDVLSKKERPITEITFKSRQFNSGDQAFWYNRYGFTREQLMEDQVFAVVWYKFFSRRLNEWLTIRPKDACYAYRDFDEGKVKIYRPFAPPNAKWLTNCDENDVGGLLRLPTTGKQLVVSKAYKDMRVFRNEGSTSVWFQNEGMVPCPDILNDLCFRFDELIFFYDNDEAGRLASRKLSSIVNDTHPNKSRALWLPESFQKDPSDMLHQRRRNEFLSFMDDHKIIRVT